MHQTSAFQLVLLLAIFLFFGCVSAQHNELKINGISFVGVNDEIEDDHLEPLVELHANYISVMPYAYGTKNSPQLQYKDLEWQWWGESPKGVAKVIEEANKFGLKAMVKPHIWIRHGAYTGDFGLPAEEDWIVWEKDYHDYIMTFAELSEKNNVPIFCIGTELTRFVEERPEFWFDLIHDIRSVYSGKLTYAANWDSYQRIPFWSELDYIGIDAYFPLCHDETPSVKAVTRGWFPHIRKMQRFAELHQKQVLFTEWGYRSADFCAREPWDYNQELSVNHQAQCNALDATFRLFWNEPWFAGGFLWKWFPFDHKVGGSQDTQFTPQNKPAEQVIQQHFSRSTGSESIHND